jgi:hypothetical protein
MRVNLPAAEPGNECLFGTLDVRCETVDGEPVVMEPIRITATAATDTAPVSGVSTYRVIKSNAMLEFAEAISEIGTPCSTPRAGG